MAKICLSPNQALEERLSNMHEQLAGATSRLDQTERELDLERATREDIIRAEVERRMAEAEKRIREEVESEFADERAMKENPKGAMPGMLLFQEIYAVEEMIKPFFGSCKVKGKNPERWLTYVLYHIKDTKEEDLYKLLPEFWEDIN
ncbi:MAG: transposase domain-containing protein [Prevotella sp.]|jgi:hypothetical protein|nr:transposase domain-containing protein [Prevotella sp.]